MKFGLFTVCSVAADRQERQRENWRWEGRLGRLVKQKVLTCIPLDFTSFKFLKMHAST